MFGFGRKHNSNRTRLDAIEAFIDANFSEEGKITTASTLDEYEAANKTLGKMIIDFLGGGEIVVDGVSYKYKFNHKVPSWDMISELQGCMEYYTVISSHFESLKSNNSSSTESTQKADLNAGGCVHTVDNDFSTGIDARNKKQLADELIMLYNHPNMTYTSENIRNTALEVKTLFARRARIIKTCLVITAVAAGAVVTFMVIKKSKKKHHHKDSDGYIEEDAIIFIDEDPIVSEDMHVTVDDSPLDTDSTTKEFKSLFDRTR